MPNSVRILIVDDSMAVRTVLRGALMEVSGLEVIGLAPNGNIALQKIEQLNPDLILLDIEMPELNGLQVLEVLRQKKCKTPVIVFSSMTVSGAQTTLDALALGALDSVTKPENTTSREDAVRHVMMQLVPKILALVKRRAHIVDTQPSVPVVSAHPQTSADLRRIDAVVIGSSTGGPNALAEILPKLPAGFPVPIVIVQHMPPVFTAMLAQRLSSTGQFPVLEAGEGQALEPAKAWIAPGNYHLEVFRGITGQVQTRIQQEAPENFCRPSVDVLFRSAAKAYGDRLLAVVLTGMGQDGLIGSRKIVENGGCVLAQDEASSVVWGMPGAVVTNKVAHAVLPLARMADEIWRRACVGRAGPN